MIDIQLNKSEKGPKYALLLLNEEPWREVFRPFYVRKLKKLQEAQNLDEFEELTYQIEIKRGRDYALFLLGRRDYFDRQLRLKLEEKLLSSKAIEEIMSYCHRCGFLDDRRVEKELILRELRRGKGPEYIKQKLWQTMGSSGKLVEELVDEDIQRDQAKELLQKRFKEASFSDFKQKQKAYSFLKRRGFSSQVISSLLTEYCDEYNLPL